MLVILHATGTGPGTCKTVTVATLFPLADFGIPVMLLEGMFAQAFEVISPVGGNVLKCFAFTAFGVAVGFAVLGVEMLVLLEPVVAETLGFWSDHFAFVVFGVFPGEVQPVGVLVLLGLFVSHDIEFFVVVYFD